MNSENQELLKSKRLEEEIEIQNFIKEFEKHEEDSPLIKNNKGSTKNSYLIYSEQK